jgi:ABC-type nitrate/sulfonate/bicarbonate transport system ATPase subunit
MRAESSFRNGCKTFRLRGGPGGEDCRPDVLCNVDFHAREGGIVSLIGKSVRCKTTLMRII